MGPRRRRQEAAAIALLAMAAVFVGPAHAHPIPTPRIVGGGKANAAGWRFAVAVEHKQRLICTGSLIAPTKVLTAAHCAKVGKRKRLSVLAGSPWISPGRRGPRIKVTGVVIDPTYNGRKVERDFAVLSLASAPDAEPIPLPTRAESKAATRPGRIVRSGGWGTRSAYGSNVARRLKATKERVLGARRCDLAYGKTRGFRQETMICALGKRIHRNRSRLPFHSTSCEGDSGGPLVANTPAGARLVGVVSAGVFPCGLGVPSIYARVASRLGFIERAVGVRGASNAALSLEKARMKTEGEVRRCGRCERSLPLTEFARRGAGFQSYCKGCQKNYDAAWYRANKAKRQAKVRADREVHVAWLDSLKQGKACADCGRTYPPYVMEWDHLPGAKKTLVLADTRRAAHSRQRILAELANCELVCANCHRERTFGNRKKAA